MFIKCKINIILELRHERRIEISGNSGLKTRYKT